MFSGLGMYESPLFLAPHEEESGGRSVPTTPLQVSAPGMSLILMWRNPVWFRPFIKLLNTFHTL